MAKKKITESNQPNFFKAFFISLGEDIKNLFVKRWLKLIGLIIMYIVPVVFLLIAYTEKKPSHWGVSLVAIPIIVVIILVYWGSFRSWLASKITKIEIENTMVAGKHIAFILLAKTLQIIMVILPFIIGYVVFKALEDFSVQVSNIFLFVALCEGLGGVFTLGDTILNVNR